MPISFILSRDNGRLTDAGRCSGLYSTRVRAVLSSFIVGSVEERMRCSCRLSFLAPIMPLTRRQSRAITSTNPSTASSRRSFLHEGRHSPAAASRLQQGRVKHEAAGADAPPVKPEPELTVSKNSIRMSEDDGAGTLQPEQKAELIIEENDHPSRKRRRTQLTADESYEPREESHQDIEETLPATPPSHEIARSVTTLLRKFYSRSRTTTSHPKTKPRMELLDNLVATILSQATTNKNSSRAFANLKGQFPDWESALQAGPEEIQTCITCGGLAQAKSRVIHNILHTLKEQHGECTLEFIRKMNNEEAKKALCSFKGVGPKTASCVLMFGLRREEFPVDTHIRRIAGRLGWMPTGSTPEKTYEVLNECLPDDLKYDLHVLLIEHGRKTCKAGVPRCDGCPLAMTCPSFARAKLECEPEIKTETGYD